MRQNQGRLQRYSYFTVFQALLYTTVSVHTGPSCPIDFVSCTLAHHLLFPPLDKVSTHAGVVLGKQIG